MKIAICFNGHLRTALAAAPNLIRYFGELSPCIDVFIHTWDLSVDAVYETNLDIEDHNRPPIEVTSRELQELSKVYNVKGFEIDNNELIIERFNSPATPRFYSFYNSVRLMTDYEIATGTKYDVCIKLRPDIIFPKKRHLAEEVIRFVLDKKSFYSDNCTLKYCKPIMIDDIFWLSSPDIMRRLSLYFFDNMLLNMHFFDYIKLSNIQVKDMVGGPYTIYRTEALMLDPLTEFDACHEIDRKLFRILH